MPIVLHLHLEDDNTIGYSLRALRTYERTLEVHQRRCMLNTGQAD